MNHPSLARHAVDQYRQREVLSASPARLLLMVFDHALVHLTRADAAHAHDRAPERTLALQRVREAVLELLATLDRERGGPIAAQLASLYGFLLSELTRLMRAYDPAASARARHLLATLRSAFESAGAAARPAA